MQQGLGIVMFRIGKELIARGDEPKKGNAVEHE